MGAHERGGSWRALADRAAGSGWRAILARSLILASGWLILTGADPSGLALGLGVVLAAVISTLWLPDNQRSRPSLRGTARFALAFLSGSLSGGLDVARRALAPRLSIDPAMIDYPLRLAAGPARNLFLGTVSLMPGTLCANVEGERCRVHVLSLRSEQFIAQLAALEALVASALGATLEPSHE